MDLQEMQYNQLFTFIWGVVNVYSLNKEDYRNDIHPMVVLHWLALFLEQTLLKELRNKEQIPLTYPGGIVAFMEREVLPYAPDAYVCEEEAKVGYELSFTKDFYHPAALRLVPEIVSDIRQLEQDADGLLAEILNL